MSNKPIEEEILNAKASEDVFNSLAQVYPVEMYDLDKEAFIRLCRSKNPNITVEQIEFEIEKTRAEENETMA